MGDLSRSRVQEALARTLDQLKLQPGRYTVRGRVTLPDNGRMRDYNLNAVVRIPQKAWDGGDRRHVRPITPDDVRGAVHDALCERIRRRVQKPWDGRERRGGRQESLDELKALLSDLKVKPWDGAERRAANSNGLLEAIRAELRRLPTAPTVTIDTRAIAAEIARHLNVASAEEPLVAPAAVDPISIDNIQSMVDELLKRQR